VIQIRGQHREEVLAYFSEHTGLREQVYVIGQPAFADRLRFVYQGREVLSCARAEWQQIWSEVSYRMQTLRDNPACAREEFDAILDPQDSGLFMETNFSPLAPLINIGAKPQIAVLREQGINGQIEMAAAFSRAGFECVDVHSTDLLEGRTTLKTFHGLVACGGFSYGDVLGAGGGWAKTIRFNERLRDAFRNFFLRADTFALGVCNGCQMLSQLQELIPGAQHWPRFVRNRSEQFEARLVMVEIMPSPSLFFKGMNGARMPIAVAHGEGRALFASTENHAYAAQEQLVAMRYIDHHGHIATTYPANPNGSPEGITALTTVDGRFTIMMPHPERLFLSTRYSWLPPHWKDEEGPWMRMFHNARAWVEFG